MTEEQLNENIIRNKIQGICQDCMYLDKIVPILNKMQNESYIDGLEQGKLDKEMENNDYDPTITTVKNIKYPKRMFFEDYEYIPKQPLIAFIENQIKEYSKFIDDSTDEVLNELQRVLDFVSGDKE